MALNRIYRETGEKVRNLALSAITVPDTAPTSIQTGVPVIFGSDAAVSLTASGNATVTRTTDLPPGVSSITYSNGGVGNASGYASFAFDGTWEFDSVTGATTSTANRAAVYMDEDGVLTMTDTDNTLYGYVDYPTGYHKVAGTLPIRIGG